MMQSSRRLSYPVVTGLVLFDLSRFFFNLLPLGLDLRFFALSFSK
jgi:hypothetical protein